MLQRRAEKRLETLFIDIGDLIFKIFDAPETKRMHTKVHLGNQDFEKHILLILMREQIELLKKEDKFIMKKHLIERSGQSIKICNEDIYFEGGFEKSCLLKRRYRY